ncbi:hypothetical protein [Candidatus Thioglobus sp.]|uniref:hypothetical protein n=1 Tax=Candidatus Thioglobus sp. TaxID=2026721 RepID=UPI003D0CE8B1
MNTLQISNKLTELGMDKPQSDFIAEAIDDKNKELASKRDLYLLGAIMIVAFGYVFTLLNTIISKLA